jgi:hypothetical protein
VRSFNKVERAGGCIQYRSGQVVFIWTSALLSICQRGGVENWQKKRISLIYK